MNRAPLLLTLLALGALACGAPPSSDKTGGGKGVIFDINPPSVDACQSDEDLSWIQTLQKDKDGNPRLDDEGEPMTGREVAREAAGDCGLGCVSVSDPDVCALECMVEQKGVTLSDECSGCYGHIVLCTINLCLPQCINDAQSPQCKACQEEKGCQEAFDTCAGDLDPKS